MRYLPLEYRLFLVALLAFLFMTGIYAIADGATVQVDVEAGGGSAIASSDSFAIESASDLDWYQDAAIFVCPLH